MGESLAKAFLLMYIKLILDQFSLIQNFFLLKPCPEIHLNKKLTYTLTVRSNKNAAAGFPAAAFLSLNQIPTLVTK